MGEDPRNPLLTQHRHVQRLYGTVVGAGALFAILAAVAAFPWFGPTDPFEAVWSNTRPLWAAWFALPLFPALARIPADSATQRITTACGFLVVLRALWLLGETVVPLPGTKTMVPILASAVPALMAVTFWRRRAFGLMTVAAGADALLTVFRLEPWASALRAGWLFMLGIWFVGRLVRDRTARYAGGPRGSRGRDMG